MTPTKKGPLGTKELNKVLQESLNPKTRVKDEKVSGSVIYRVGDRIMQVKNNYDITWEKENKLLKKLQFMKAKDKIELGTGVFNGEIGTILEVDNKEKVIKIKFDDEKIAYYEFSELDQIEHSYAITIHKSQRK